MDMGKQKMIEGRKAFQRELLQIAVPVILQCLMQSSFSVVDQIMTGQLGSISIAGIGLGEKFASIYYVVIAAVASVAGIMLVQYIGKKDNEEAGRSFYTNLAGSFLLAAVFTALSMMMPYRILGLYTNDAVAVQGGVEYLRIYALSFLPVAVTSIFLAYLRCACAAKIPLYAGIFSSVAHCFKLFTDIRESRVSGNGCERRRVVVCDGTGSRLHTDSYILFGSRKRRKKYV